MHTNSKSHSPVFLMASQFTMPGSFPGLDSFQSASPAVADVADDSFELFSRKENVGNKTRAQRHMMGQIQALVYFLVGYQYIKYCHSACLLPVITHMVVQKLVSSEAIANQTSLVSGVLVVNEIINEQRRQDTSAGTSTNRSGLANLWMTKACLIVYWKFVAVAIYHILFVFWLQQIENEGMLDLLVNGTWWVVSFIGERVPDNYLGDDNFFLRMYKLGLVELLLSDVAILVLQLILYQCVFVQSTLSPKGHALNEDEIYILRTKSGMGGDVDFDDDMIPDILHIRLYEAFRKDAFVPTLA